jgi:hypothetical protein
MESRIEFFPRLGVAHRTPAVLMSIVRQAIFAIGGLLSISVFASASQVIDFENITTGGPGGAGQLALVLTQYGSVGVTFNGPKVIDYSQGPFAISGFAHSGTKAIETCVGLEFCTSPIKMIFTTPQRTVKVWFGYSAPLNQALLVDVVGFDGTGAQVAAGSGVLNSSPNPQPISSAIAVTSSVANISSVTISLSGPSVTFNNNLAIDDVEFDTAGPPSPCTATQAPTVALTEPPDGLTVYDNEFLFQGSVAGNGAQLDAATVTATVPNGTIRSADMLSAGLLSPSGGNFGSIREDGLLSPGVNTVTVTARNCFGAAQASRTVTFLQVSPPQVFGSEVNQGLPTYSLVAGKTTLVRVYVGVQAGAAATRITHAVLTVSARDTSTTFTVNAIIPNVIFTNVNQRYTENDNINFYLPGAMVPAGRYSFSAQLFDGSTLLTTVDLPGGVYVFSRTQDLKLMVVLPDISRYGQTLSDLALLSDYLDDMARVFPVRDGWGLVGDQKGLQVSLRFFEPVCDGSFPPFPNCGPSQEEITPGNSQFDPLSWFKWKLVQPQTTGQLRTVCVPVFTTIPCQGTANFRYPNNGSGGFATMLVPSAFVYFPGWPPNTADSAYDLNYDGRIDASELSLYVSEFFNNSTGTWSTNISQLQPGDVVHNFVDSDRDIPPQLDPGETPSPFTQVKLVSWMRQKARALADASGINYAAYVVWQGMDQQGTGGGAGDYGGNTMWAVLKQWPAFHQEFGHVLGLVPPGSPNAAPGNLMHSKNFVITDPRSFDILRRKALTNPISVMAAGLGTPYYNSLLETYEYNWLVSNRASLNARVMNSNPGVANKASQFLLAGYLDRQSHFIVVESKTVENLTPTPPARGSAYSLCFERLKPPAQCEAVPVDFDSPTEHGHRHGLPIYHANTFVKLVRSLPIGTRAVELKHHSHVLFRMSVPAHRPQLKLRPVEISEAGDAITLGWDAVHPDGARMTFDVFYSPDGGKNWEIVGTGIRQTALKWALHAAAGAKDAVLRVVATDGFHSVDARTEYFRVPAKAPLVTISASSDQRAIPGAPIQLRAVAFDLQDGLLPETALNWSSDVAGDLGSGRMLLATLQTGRHTVTVRGRNSWGLSSSAQTTIEVGPETAEKQRGKSK